MQSPHVRHTYGQEGGADQARSEEVGEKGGRQAMTTGSNELVSAREPQLG